VNGAFSKPSPQVTRKAIKLGELSSQFPFSDGILAGYAVPGGTARIGSENGKDAGED